MARLATAADLEDYLQTTFTAAETLQAETLLDHASGIIRRVAGQDFDQVVDDVVTLPASYTSTLLLPQLPATAVASVVTSGTTLTVDVDYEAVLPAGILRRLKNAKWAKSVTVTYTHGFATVPDDLVAICTEMAARAWVNPRGLLSEQIGNYSARWGADNVAGLGLNVDERAIVQSYRAVPGY